ncbi:MAG: hypothetical protein ABEJ24_01800 [Candidatus Magasanikbacteria bacterium]
MSLLEDLKPIFWDVDFSDLNTEEHKEYIITRIAEKGRWRDVKWLVDEFTKKIKKIVLNSRNTSDRTKSFWQVVG